jgi:hypothetical protein
MFIFKVRNIIILTVDTVLSLSHAINVTLHYLCNVLGNYKLVTLNVNKIYCVRNTNRKLGNPIATCSAVTFRRLANFMYDH